MLTRRLLTLLLLIGSFPGQASAQEADVGRTAAARSLFEEGLSLGQRGQWEEAADRYRRVLELRPSPQVRFNLAQALAEIDEYVESLEHLRQILRDEDAPEEVRLAAARLAPEVEPNIGRITVVLTGDSDGVELSLDDEPFDLALVGVSVPADPGRHVVTARRSGHRITAEEVAVAAGRDAEVTLVLPRAPPSPSDAAASIVADDGVGTDVADESSGGASPWLWVAIGALAIGAAVAITLLLVVETGPEPLDGNLMPGRLVFE